jgi:hypothetical protein
MKHADSLIVKSPAFTRSPVNQRRYTMKIRIRLFHLALFVATVSPAFAGNIFKTSEFGAGTRQPRSHLRTFDIPCQLGIAAMVKFQRLGPVNANNDVPIIIEVHEPDMTAGQENPVYYEESAMAKLTEQTIIVRVPGKKRGCSLPWGVRVRYANEDTAPSRVFGSIRLDFNGGERNIDFKSVGIVGKGRSTQSETQFYGIGQGKVEIAATWYHFIGGIQFVGPNPIKLEISLVDPNGTVVKTVKAYSSDELRSELTKFRLTYQATDCLPGKWKLSVYNPTNDDANFRSLNATFAPDCL